MKTTNNYNPQFRGAMSRQWRKLSVEELQSLKKTMPSDIMHIVVDSEIALRTNKLYYKVGKVLKSFIALFRVVNNVR